MPKRTDIKSVMVIGSGPIVIGQAAEFDYSGTQACRVLREEGIRVILVNSNPATIMTDPEMADATYIEPISTPILEQIIAKERPDALLPTLLLWKPSIAARIVSSSKRSLRKLVQNPHVPTSHTPLKKSTRSPKSSVIRWSCAQASPWVALVPASRTTKRNCTASQAQASIILRPTRC